MKTWFSLFLNSIQESLKLSDGTLKRPKSPVLTAFFPVSNEMLTYIHSMLEEQSSHSGTWV